MPGSGESSRTNSQRIRDEHSWIWAVRSKWSSFDKIEIKRPFSVSYAKEKVGARQLWVRLVSASTEMVVQVPCTPEAKIAQAAIMACDPESHIYGIALASEIGGEIKVVIFDDEDVHEECLKYGLHVPAWEENQRLLNARE